MLLLPTTRNPVAHGEVRRLCKPVSLLNEVAPLSPALCHCNADQRFSFPSSRPKLPKWRSQPIFGRDSPMIESSLLPPYWLLNADSSACGPHRLTRTLSALPKWRLPWRFEAYRLRWFHSRGSIAI